MNIKRRVLIPYRSAWRIVFSPFRVCVFQMLKNGSAHTAYVISRLEKFMREERRPNVCSEWRAALCNSCAVCADFALLGETPIDRRHPEREEYR